jgi:hypothetical protein
VGILLALVGVAVLAVAIIALHNPKSTGPDAAGGSSPAASGTTPSSSGATSTSTGPTPSSRATTTPAVSRSTSPSDSAENSSEALAAAQTVPLVVLNNTTISGLAAQAATRFEDGGWTVTSEGNLTNNIISTCAYYDPDVTGAEKAAKALQAQYPTIKRVEPKFDELPSGPVVVVLTPDYSAG